MTQFVSGPGFGFLPPKQLDGVLNDLHLGKSFLDELMPPTPTRTRQGLIKKASTNRFGLGTVDASYQPGDTVKSGPGAQFADVRYALDLHAWKEPTPWDDADSVSEYLPLFKFNAQVALDVVRTHRDLAAARAIIAPTWSYSTSPAEADRWSASGSKPLKQLVAMKQAMRHAMPNCLMIGQDVMAAFMTNDSVLDGLNVNADHGLAEKAYLEAVARKLMIEHVVVVDSVYNTTETNSSYTLAEMFAGRAWMGRINTAPGLANAAGAIDGLQSTALARIQMKPLDIREFDNNDNRSRIAEAFCIESTIVADTRLGGMLSAILG